MQETGELERAARKVVDAKTAAAARKEAADVANFAYFIAHAVSDPDRWPDSKEHP
jgi:NTP pyrophosphatase (non-canonical NTP hydrolase)